MSKLHLFYEFYRKKGYAVRQIAINMHNRLFCNAIADTIRRSSNEPEIYTISSPDKAADEYK